MFIPPTDPTYDLVRRDLVRRSPRFIALLRKAKLDPAVFARSVIHE